MLKEAVALTVVVRFSVLTRGVVVRRVGVVVAGCGVGAAWGFEFVANAVTVGVVEAGAVAVIVRLGVHAGAVVETKGDIVVVAPPM